MSINVYGCPFLRPSRDCHKKSTAQRWAEDKGELNYHSLDLAADSALKTDRNPNNETINIQRDFVLMILHKTQIFQIRCGLFPLRKSSSLFSKLFSTLGLLSNVAIVSVTNVLGKTSFLN